MLGFVFKPFGCLFTLLGFVVFTAVSLALALFYGLDWYLPRALEDEIEQSTGFEVQLGESEVRIFDYATSFKDVLITSREGYPTADFLRIRELTLDVANEQEREGELILEKVIIDVEQVTLSNGSDGLNLIVFGARLAAGFDKLLERFEGLIDFLVEKDEQPTRWTIRRLVLRLGEVRNNLDGSQLIVIPVQLEEEFEEVAGDELVARVRQFLRQAGIPLL